MRTTICLLAALFVLPFQSFAQEVADKKHRIDLKMDAASEEDPSTAGQVRAISVALDEWNDLLNSQYQNLMKSLDEAGQAKLRNSQKAWIAWRDAEKEALSAIYGKQEGTMWIPLHNYAVMNLTRERALRLQFFNSLDGEPFALVIRGQTVEIAPSASKEDIKTIFRKVAPEAAPSVDNPDFLQYDIVLAFEQAPASFVFDFDSRGGVSQIRIDAYMKEQNPTVVSLIESLQQNVGEATVENGEMIWQHGGWIFSHFEGGDGEDSTYSAVINPL